MLRLGFEQSQEYKIYRWGTTLQVLRRKLELVWLRQTIGLCFFWVRSSDRTKHGLNKQGRSGPTVMKMAVMFKNFLDSQRTFSFEGSNSPLAARRDGRCQHQRPRQCDNVFELQS